MFFIYAAAFLLIWLLFNVNFAAVIVSLVLIYRGIDQFISGNAFDSKFIKVCAVPLLYIFSLELIILPIWLINRNFPLDKSVLILLIFIILAHAYKLVAEKRNKISNVRPTRMLRRNVSMPDVIALTIGMLITSVIIAGPFIRSHTLHASNFLGAINGNVDDAAHIGMLNDHIQFNRGVFYHSDAAGSVRSSSEVNIYPQAWHAANAAVINAAYPDIHTGQETIIAYVISKAFWFLLLIIFFVRSIFTLYDSLSAQMKRPVVITFWLTCASLFFSYYFLIDSFKEGFYSFFPQLIAVPLLALLLNTMSKSSTNSNAEIPLRNVVLPITLVCIASSLSWLLMLPVFILIAVLAAHVMIKPAASWKESLRTTLSGILVHLPWYLIVTLSILIQIYLSTVVPSTGEERSFLDTISLPGGIAIFKDTFYYFIFTGILLCLALFVTRTTTYLKSLFTILLPTLTFATSVYVLQIIHTNHNEYYYYKALNTFLILALPIGIVGYGLFILKVTELKRSPFVGGVLTAFLSIMLVQLIGLNPLSVPDGTPPVAYLKGDRHPNIESTSATWKLLGDQVTERNYSDKTNIIYYQPNILMNQSYYNTMILKSNKPESICFDNSLRASIQPDLTVMDMLKQIKKSCGNNQKVIMITSPEYVPVIKLSMAEINLNNVITVKTYANILSE